MQAIKEFKCPVCDELKSAPTHRKATTQHAESPNSVDYVQVELIQEDASGKTKEIKQNVLTVVDLATDFCQQVVVQPGPHGFGSFPYSVDTSVWCPQDRSHGS